MRAAPLPALAAAAVAALAPSASAARASCPDAYQYAGVVAPAPAAGIAATITALRPPDVLWGHVAAWVGVGGPGAGPNGADEWLQVGLSGFERGAGSLYAEVARPGQAPTYTAVLATVAAGEPHEVAVLEQAGRPGWWRVWVDGRPVGAPVLLPGSHGRWHPMAMAESWNGGRGVCNGFRYAFARLRLAAAPGGSWQPFARGRVLARGGDRVLARRPADFVAAGGS